MDAGSDSPHYVYAVVRSTLDLAPEQRGIEGEPVGRITLGALSVLASAISTERVRPTRANLSAHQDVVSSAHAAGTALPIRFGTVMPDRESVVEELLGPGASQLEAMLEDFDGKDEFRVKCRYVGEIALREVVQGSRRIQRLKAQVSSAGPAARQADQIHLGELVVAELERIREADANHVLSTLSPHMVAWEPVEDASDDVPLHAALLVQRSDVTKLETTLEAFAARQRDRMDIELVGPLPLWDFSHVTPGAA